MEDGSWTWRTSGAAGSAGAAAADTCVSLVRWQQGERTLAVVAVNFCHPLGSVQTSHFTDITEALEKIPVMFWVGFNHPLRSHPVQSPARL